MSIWPARVKSGRIGTGGLFAVAALAQSLRLISAVLLPRRVNYVLLLVRRGPEQAFEEAAVLALTRLDAPWLIDGPINGEAFQCYVEKVLVPTLKPGDIVIMDNLGSHKGKAVRRAIRAVGAQLKHWLRKAARRTIDDLYEAIGPECANYFANAGYDPT